MARKTKGGTTRADVLHQVSHMVEAEWERAADRLIEREPDFGGFSPGWEKGLKAVLDQRKAAKREIAYIVLKGLGKEPPFAPGLDPLASAALDAVYQSRKKPDFGHMVPTEKKYDGQVLMGWEWRAPAVEVRRLHLCLVEAWQAARGERDPALRLEAAIGAADAERTRQGVPARSPGEWPEEKASKWPIVLRDGKLVTDRTWRTPPLLPLLEKIAKAPGRWGKAQLISLVREVRPGVKAVDVKNERGRATEALRQMEKEAAPLVLAIKANVQHVAEVLFRAAVPMSPGRRRG